GTADQRGAVLLLLEAVDGLVESARGAVQQPLGIGLLDALAHLVGSARRAHLGSCLVSLILGHDAGVDESVEGGVRSGQLIGLVRALFEAVAVLVQSVGETGGSLGHALWALVEFLAAVDQVVESSLIGIPGAGEALDDLIDGLRVFVDAVGELTGAVSELLGAL